MFRLETHVREDVHIGRKPHEKHLVPPSFYSLCHWDGRNAVIESFHPVHLGGEDGHYAPMRFNTIVSEEGRDTVQESQRRIPAIRFMGLVSASLLRRRKGFRMGPLIKGWCGHVVVTTWRRWEALGHPTWWDQTQKQR